VCQREREREREKVFFNLRSFFEKQFLFVVLDEDSKRARDKREDEVLEVNFFVTQSVSLPREERVPPRAEERKQASRTARVSISIASLKI
jgi:hypothetical protein